MKTILKEKINKISFRDLIRVIFVFNKKEYFLNIRICKQKGPFQNNSNLDLVNVSNNNCIILDGCFYVKNFYTELNDDLIINDIEKILSNVNYQLSCRLGIESNLIINDIIINPN